MLQEQEMKLTEPILMVLFVAAIGVYVWTSRSASPSQVAVVCETTKGPLEITVVPEWSPLAAVRFLQMVDNGFFTGLPFFRCMEGFVCQFGPRPGGKSYPPFADDPQRPDLRRFKPGYISFAGYERNSRAYNIFISLTGAESLGSQPWETPFGYVTDETMRTTVSQLYKGYGEMAPNGTGPDGQKIEVEDGAAYLAKNFPLLDSFKSCKRK
jgi:peptidyl-prolyl cis-trans isomerase A (cyclophilin A)